jgi:hypothetical protein
MWTTSNRKDYEWKGLRYPSDMTEAEWARVKPLADVPQCGQGRRRVVDLREVLNAVFYITHALLPDAMRLLLQSAGRRAGEPRALHACVVPGAEQAAQPGVPQVHFRGSIRCHGREQATQDLR